MTCKVTLKSALLSRRTQLIHGCAPFSNMPTMPNSNAVEVSASNTASDASRGKVRGTKTQRQEKREHTFRSIDGYQNGEI